MPTWNSEKNPSYLFADDPKPEVKQPHSNAQKLLNFLFHWPKDTVTVRDIRIYGPRPIRDREIALNSAQTLVERGWLVPVKARRRDMIEWQIIRQLVVHPTVATEPAE